MSLYGECYKCGADLICLSCESAPSLNQEVIVEGLYQFLQDELGDRLSKSEIEKLYNSLGDFLLESSK